MDFNGGGLTRTEDMPHFLSGVRLRAEASADMAPGELEQVLITEYARRYRLAQDRSVFGDVVGISLLSPCTSSAPQNRLALGATKSRSGAAVGYLLRGRRRTIPGVESLRYSITFRNVLERDA